MRWGPQELFNPLGSILLFIEGVLFPLLEADQRLARNQKGFSSIFPALIL
jgi:hypothetical protein